MTKKELYLEIARYYPTVLDVRKFASELGFKKVQSLQATVRHMREAGVDIEIRPTTPVYHKEFTYDFVAELNREIRKQK